MDGSSAGRRFLPRCTDWLRTSFTVSAHFSTSPTSAENVAPACSARQESLPEARLVAVLELIAEPGLVLLRHSVHDIPYALAEVSSRFKVIWELEAIERLGGENDVL